MADNKIRDAAKEKAAIKQANNSRMVRAEDNSYVDKDYYKRSKAIRKKDLMTEVRNPGNEPPGAYGPIKKPPRTTVPTRPAVPDKKLLPRPHSSVINSSKIGDVAVGSRPEVTTQTPKKTMTRPRPVSFGGGRSLAELASMKLRKKD